MTGRRFQVTYSSQTIFVDRLRFGCDTDLSRAFLGACAEDPKNVDLIQQPVMFDIPKQDLDAYRRACAAFNQVMDEHEQASRAMHVAVHGRFPDTPAQEPEDDEHLGN